ncbi:MAG: HAD family phosphatase [Candidatus Caenarcaniphilales bacterium]|nr:HAD family phosphatase [Candidatus Caenarcaniphilales bacterium]
MQVLELKQKAIDLFNESKAVIFDMDGVMIFNTPFHQRALKDFCELKGKPLSDEDMENKIYGRTNREWLLNLFDSSLSDELVEEYAQEKELMYRNIYKNDIEAAPGLMAFLELLDLKKLPRAIATSAPPVNVDFTLDSINAKSFFEIIINDTMVKNSKPHPEIYLKAIEVLGFEPHECLVFEDSKSGIKAGIDSGAKVIAIESSMSPKQCLDLGADSSISDFSIFL